MMSCVSVHANNPNGSESMYAEKTLDHVIIDRH